MPMPCKPATTCTGDGRPCLNLRWPMHIFVESGRCGEKYKQQALCMLPRGCCTFRELHPLGAGFRGMSAFWSSAPPLLAQTHLMSAPITVATASRISRWMW